MSAAVLGASFAALYAGHQVGDHIVQTDRQAAGKAAGKGWLGPMAGHLVGYGLAQALALLAAGLAGVPLSVRYVAAGLAVSVLSHGLIDRRRPVRWLLRHTGSSGFAEMTAPLSFL